MRNIKTTVKAVLINITPENGEKINELMTVFSSAIRFAFNRMLDSDIKKGELEKLISRKYKLNIRQSKDAVEKACQIILSQKSLLKTYYQNYKTKVEKIERDLEKAKSEKRIDGLNKKLKKRKRKLENYETHIKNNTIPKIIFGGRKNFIKRCKGSISNKEWKDLRDNNYYSRGDKSKKGNPNLRIALEKDMTYLEISTLEKTKSNRSIKIKVPIYLPQKLSKKTGKINGRNYRQMVLDYLETSEAYKVELIKKNNKIYVHITIDESKLKEFEEETKYYNGIIGIDTNPDGLALTKVDLNGNYKWSKYLKQSELLYARTNRRENLIGELVTIAIKKAKEENSLIAIEDLKFKDDKDVKKKFSRIKHQFVYRKLLNMLESKAERENIEIIKVKPQFTSKIGLYKYSHQYGLDVHNAASIVIGRRALGFNEKIPKVLKGKLIDEKEIQKFNKYNNWKQWSIISKKIKEKGGEKPGLWQRRRKSILGLIS